MRQAELRVIIAVLAATSLGLAAGPGLSATAKTTTHAAAKKAPAKSTAKKPTHTTKKVAPPPDPEPEPVALPPPTPVQAQVKTSDDVKKSSVEGAATAPLRDFNVMKTQIPDVLLAALTDPYSRPPARWRCQQLAALIAPLDEALGPDIDLNPASGDESLSDKGKEAALGTAADLASGAIPFRGVVRRVSGAEAHDRMVQQAILAGSVRRAYLKGLGEAKGCPPPSTPSHEREGAVPAVDQRDALKPKYPIH